MGVCVQLEFGLFMAKHDPAGVGLASLVDIMSLRKAFGSDGGLSTQEFLNTTHRSRSVGLRGGEADYVASFSDRYPSELGGVVRERINSTRVIKVLSSFNDWTGNGHIGDGRKDSLSRSILIASEKHKQYVEDSGLPEDLRALATKTAKATRLWWMDLATYIDGEYLMLATFNLDTKQILLLLSNHIVQILEDIYEVRCTAAHTDLANWPAAGIRFAWVTLQAHSVMTAYRESKFCNHQSIASTFIRFLTRNLADQSSLGLKSNVDKLETEVKKLTKDIKEKAGLDALNKLNTKVNRLNPGTRT